MSTGITRHDWNTATGALTVWVGGRRAPIELDRFEVAELAAKAGFTVPKIVAEYLAREAADRASDPTVRLEPGRHEAWRRA